VISLCLSVYVSLYVYLLVTTVSCAKTAEPIEMPFGLWTRVGTGNRILGGGGSPGKGHILGDLGPQKSTGNIRRVVDIFDLIR